jgi:pimeloyl-ACP methyl ester carboxylesterase
MASTAKQTKPVKQRSLHKRLLPEKEKIQVHVRIRPLQKGELPNPVLRYTDKSVEGLPFDCVHGPGVSQKAVFESLVPLADSWIDGYNACIFAYGQTGSGKTHTMLGEDGGKRNLDGVIPQIVTYALGRLKEELDMVQQLEGTVSQFRLQGSYIELYNEQLRDLLFDEESTSAEANSGGNGKQSSTKTAPTGLVQIRENEDGVVFTEGATWVTVKSPEDVLDLIRKGSARRATHSTNMNLHSSRSHAVFALRMEHRWKDESCKTPSMYKQKSSLLNLVDLAGSEYAKKTGNVGDRLQESIAINTGLFVLGNVIAALAGHRDRRVGDHIPYRDSILTRLLQSSLGGDARTVMIACMGPGLDNYTESLSTLKYATSTRSIDNSAKLQIENVQLSTGPMDDDVADPDDEMDRRALWVETSYGDVFCRCLGDQSDDLILYVHGSGPTNSSTWWNQFCYEAAVYSQAVVGRKFFQVAIDCPGYGRSFGDRQSIRSYPGALLKEIIHALGKSAAYCLVGSSQGCCSVFNATLEVPTITSFLAVMHPVGHDVFRYAAIKQPTLMAFDVDDAGHPVKVGRWMKDVLPTNTYFEFASSKDPFWLADHFVDEMLKMFAGSSSSSSTSKPTASVFTKVLESCTRVAGGLIAWVEHGKWGEPTKAIELKLHQPPSQCLSEMLSPEMLQQLTMSSDTASYYDDPVGLEWKTEMDAKTGRIFYVCEQTLETVFKRPRNGVVHPPAAEGGKKNDGSSQSQQSKNGEERKGEGKPDLFAEEEKGRATKAGEETPEAQEERLKAENAEDKCLRCGESLWRPARMSVCRHVICGVCHEETTKFLAECPVCRQKAQVERSAEHQQSLEGRPDAAGRSKRYDDFMEQQSTTCRLIVEYGNTAEGSAGSAYCVEAFVRCLKLEKGSKYKGKGTVDARTVLSRVDFNINPDFPKAAIKVLAPPFKLQRTMGIKFVCELLLHFQGLPAPIVVPYYMHHEPVTSRRLIISFSNWPPSPATLEAAATALSGQPAGRRGKVTQLRVFDHGWGESEPEPPAVSWMRI